jgi:hypothetical protein
MPSPGPGQKTADGGDSLISPPDLTSMYYSVSKDSSEPSGALSRWGHDVAVTASDYSSNDRLINDVSQPEHIFVRNVLRSDDGTNGQYKEYITHNGETITVKSRGYDYVYDDNGDRVDDYFLEDPTDDYYSSYNKYDEIDGTIYTAPSYINVQADYNEKTYYVDGNVYMHATPTWCLKFKQSGTRITIVAKGNITISDEFYYNADYDSDQTRSGMDSTVVSNPSDALCLIALKNPACSNSGNIYIGDSACGTGGSIHAMLYAENNFIDNNLGGDQPFISVFGSMSAGNLVDIKRTDTSSSTRTRLDITFDARIRDGEIDMPGLPHPENGERSIQIDTEWTTVPGTWSSWSSLAQEIGAL